MSERYKVRNTEGLYFITFTITSWVDLFVRPIYKHIILDSLVFCQRNKGLKVHAYVIMSSHLHAIVSSEDGYSLQDTVRDMKKYTSRQLVHAIIECPESRREWLLHIFEEKADSIKRGINYKVWQDGFHPVELSTTEMINQRLNYIHNNPVEEEIVNNAEDYKYSSAINYAGGIGEIKIELL
jgi:REP element-mobilizing transposase RayT